MPPQLQCNLAEMALVEPKEHGLFSQDVSVCSSIGNREGMNGSIPNRIWLSLAQQQYHQLWTFGIILYEDYLDNERKGSLCRYFKKGENKLLKLVCIFGFNIP